MKLQLPPLPADPLADALQVLRPVGALYSRCHLTAPWGFDIPPLEQMLLFHVVIAGECWLRTRDTQPRLLQRGALALTPHGHGHQLLSAPGAAAHKLFDVDRELVSERYEVIRFGGGGAPTELICAAVRFDHPAAKHLISLLPAVICIDSTSALQSEWLHSTLTLMAAEASAVRVGGEAVITRLADIVVIQAIRAWLEKDPGAQTGWLRALRDRQIGRAVAMIHREPARSWTLAELAEAVAMSRSAFAARFSELIGMTPMRYITHWRMQVAFTLLQQRDARVSDLASQLGYRSEAAFSRAFKRKNGISPSEVRLGE